MLTAKYLTKLIPVGTVLYIQVHGAQDTKGPAISWQTPSVPQVSSVSQCHTVLISLHPGESNYLQVLTKTFKGKAQNNTLNASSNVLCTLGPARPMKSPDPPFKAPNKWLKLVNHLLKIVKNYQWLLHWKCTIHLCKSVPYSAIIGRGKILVKSLPWKNGGEIFGESSSK